jgi:phosphate transport system protein
MIGHLQRELEKLKKQILALGALAESRVEASIKAVEDMDETAAQWIITADHEVDEKEVEVEEECLKLLALYQPVAVDLRFIAVVIKINNDLERIADEAVNIARRVKDIRRLESPPENGRTIAFDIREMGEKTLVMLKKSLDALVHLDTDLAYMVLFRDDEVDELYRKASGALQEAIRMDPNQVGLWLNLLLTARHLERIGDHATNIAEEVIYLVQGQTVRHMNVKSLKQPG